jgi:hypothetical protein
MMRRRDFIPALSGAAVWPLTMCAQRVKGDRLCLGDRLKSPQFRHSECA